MVTLTEKEITENPNDTSLGILVRKKYNLKLDLISSLEKTLKSYKSELEKSPESTFYSGLIKNTEEYINELKNNFLN